MLVLTRREGQGLLIGDNIYVHMIRSANGEIRVGIDAPKTVAVVRLELLSEAKQPSQQGGRR